jgi:alpha-1,2-mannosyltransferase
MPKAPPNLKLDRRLAALACAAWVIAWAIVSLLVSLHYTERNESIIYANSAQDWMARRGLYDRNNGIDGFLYLPQSAMLYAPFALPGHPGGDIAWRAVGLALYATGIWRMARDFSAQRALIVFTAATAFALPPALGALRNGQANLHIAGLMLLAAADLRQERWAWATFWLILGFAIKPIMLVMILLTAAVYRPMIWRLLVGAAVLMLAPLASTNFHYVLSQYQGCWQMLKVSSQPDRPFCNLQGLAWKLGIPLSQSQTTFQVLAIAAALATLGLCLLGARRWGEPVRAYLLPALAAVYLVLLNPRTEASSYVMLAPMLAIPAALLLLTQDRYAPGWALVVMCVLLTCDGWAYRWTEYWLKPIVCLAFTVMLLRALFQPPRPIAWT